MKQKMLISIFIFILITFLSVNLIHAGNSPKINLVREEGLAQIIYLPIVERLTPWQEVGIGSASDGGISNTPGNSQYPSVAIASDNSVYVAWQVISTGNLEIYVRTWDGRNWLDVGLGSASGGGISNDAGNSWNPSIAIAPDGTPYVAWQDNNPNNLNDEIFVRVWNGNDWSEVGAGSASGGGISNTPKKSWFPSLAITPNGTPYIAWQDSSSGNFEIYVRAWNGSDWVEVGASSASGGGISNTNGDSKNPSLAIAPDGTPYVAWEDYSNGGDGDIYVRAWKGGSWEEVGTGSASGDGVSNSLGWSENAALAIAPNGTPFLAWDDWSSGYAQIYVRAWNGVIWSEVGLDSASGEGISKSSGYAGMPTIGISSTNVPFIAWSNIKTGEEGEIYVRAWNGSDWIEVGEGSASDGGISNTNSLSNFPSLAINSNDTPYLTWAEKENNVHDEIYIRFWNGTSQ